jgi:hypothetical protein
LSDLNAASSFSLNDSNIDFTFIVLSSWFLVRAHRLMNLLYKCRTGYYELYRDHYELQTVNFFQDCKYTDEGRILNKGMLNEIFKQKKEY